MKKYVAIITVVLAWVFSTVNTSGFGLMYDTATKTNIFIVLWFIGVSTHSHQRLPLNKNLGLFFFTILSFVVLPLLNADSWDGFIYLLMVPLVYCFSQVDFSKKDIELIGYIIGALGIFVLLVYSRTSILSGWNDNQISMIGLFSYLFFSITLYGNMTGKKLTIGLLLSALYAIELSQTASRGAVIFITAAILFAYKGDFIKKYINSKRFVPIALSVPLLIAFIFVLFPDFSLFQYFNEWSQQNYDKSAFNGRDELWLEAWHRLLATNLLGEGEFLINHHNSAVAAMSVFGVIGYICWYKLLAAPIRFISHYVNDNTVFGCFMSFFLIFWQQSFDMGFIQPASNMIPYIILGLGISRARQIQQYGNN